MPDAIVAVPAVPRNRDRQEAGAAGEADPARAPHADEVASRDVLADPTSLDAFVAAAQGPGDRTSERRRPVAVVGTGVIGASWAAHFLAHGLDVVATDPAPGAEERLRADVAAHWPTLERIGWSRGPPRSG